MFRASDLLKETRLEKAIDLEDIAKKLKVPLKYLQAIENDERNGFPGEPYCSLIINDYSEFLGLNGPDIIRLFNRDFDNQKKVSAKVKRIFSFTPQSTFAILTILSLLIFSVYLVIEYVRFNRPPKITVNWPQNQKTDQSVLYLSGSTDPESTVRVNQDLVVVDVSGNFSKKINLVPGDNQITVESTSHSGVSSSVSRTLTFTPPNPPPE